MNRQSQGENSYQEVSNRLPEAVQGLFRAGNCPDQDQEYDTDDSRHGDGDGFSGPEDNCQSHYRQSPLTLWCQAFGRGGKKYGPEHHNGGNELDGQFRWSEGDARGGLGQR